MVVLIGVQGRGLVHLFQMVTLFYITVTPPCDISFVTSLSGVVVRLPCSCWSLPSYSLVYQYTAASYTHASDYRPLAIGSFS